jgi:FKBP-type peptidyl-prolyl cis-trans isomerase SlpA
MSNPLSVQPDSYLTLHYRVALASVDQGLAPVVDTFGARPATLQLGTGQLAEPLEALLLGLHPGERASFELPAGDAYGSRNPELIQKLSRSVLDAESEDGTQYEPGDWVEIMAPPAQDGAPRMRVAGRLKELNDQFALFDFNHPLAGQAIRFEVKIIGIL